MRSVRFYLVGSCVVACLLAPRRGVESARAELQSISADVDVSATIFDSDTVLVSDGQSITVAAGQTGVARAQAVRLDVDQRELAATVGSAMFFRDPFPDPPDPIDEFGGELFAFTTDNTLNEQATGDVFESRTIVLTADEAELPDGTTAVITADMYLNGAVVVFSDRLNGDLRGLEALAGFEIELQRTGADPLLVQSAVLEVEGALGNQINVSGDGALAGFGFPVIDVSSDFPDLGDVYVVLFPQLLIPYAYTVDVGEEYVLVSRLRLKLTTVPDHVGVGITTGGPFQNLAPALNAMLGDATGDALQSRVNALLAAVPAITPPAFPFELVLQACAPLGMESLGLVALLGVANLARRRTRSIAAGRSSS